MMEALTPVITVLGIMVIVLLVVLCWVLRRFHESTQNIMTQMRVDTYALREKFCGGELDPGEPVKYRVKPMPKEYVSRVKLKEDENSSDPDSGPPPSPFHQITPFDQITPSYPDFAMPPPSMPDFMKPIIKIEELKEVLKKKVNWTRHELLRELRISWTEQDWRD